MQKIDRAILVALNRKTPLKYTEASINELEALASSCNIKTVDKIIQSNNTIDPRYYIGSGKVNEIKKAIDVLNIDIVIFDDPLSAGQIRNLEKELDVQIMDRSFLILQIFAQRAKTRESMVEVSLAQKLYMLPRLVGMRSSLSRQGGGSFNAKGPGETKLETDRRRLSVEITELKNQLNDIRKVRVLNSNKRVENLIPIVAIVGYTNAGKSSLMNRFLHLYDKEDYQVIEKDMLFTTLDTKAKRIKKDNHPAFILIDTVGFISKIPNELIASFESTLLDIKDADLILHIVNGLDYSDTEIELTRNILSKLVSPDIPRLLVVTKKDLRTESPLLTDDFIYVSNKTGEGFDQLYQSIDSILYDDAKIYNISLPFSKGKAYQYLKENTHILNETYSDDSINLRVLLRPAQIGKFNKYIV